MSILTWRRLRAAGVASVTGAIACGTAQAAGRVAPAVSPIPVVRFRDGATAFSTYSGLDDAMRAVVRDSITWSALWRRIERPFYPRAAVPAVNFTRDMVIVAALGARPTSGYDIVIEAADRDSSGITVDVRVTSPAPGCPVEAAVTQPVDLARVAVADLPIRFHERRVVVPCDIR